MKFLCGHCKAKYQIADEKAEGRTLRMTCRQCGKEIIIQSQHRGVGAASGAAGSVRSGAAPGSMPPSALAAGFRRQVATGPSRRPPPPVSPQWHVAINDIPVGPMRLEEVARKIEMGAVDSESLAWREGLDDWLPAREIPELARILSPQSAPSAASLHAAALDQRYPQPIGKSAPAEPIHPAARSSAIPIGGRLGADVPQAMEELYTPISRPESALEQVHMPQPMARDTEPFAARPVAPSWGPMFLLVCGGAFIMMLGVVLGVKVLGPSERVERTIETKPEASQTAQTDDTGGMVELELQEIDGELEEEAKKPTRRTGSGKSAQTGSGKSTATSGKGRTLSKEERDMLARMGSGFNSAPSNLAKRTAAGGARSGAQAGGLKAEQLSRVVSRGKKQLQRCYESALRTNPSDQTIRLDIEITVGLSGAVTNVKTKGKPLGDMSRCIARTIRMWTFPQASEPTRTSFPVVFQPGA